MAGCSIVKEGECIECLDCCGNDTGGGALSLIGVWGVGGEYVKLLVLVASIRGRMDSGSTATGTKADGDVLVLVGESGGLVEELLGPPTASVYAGGPISEELAEIGELGMASLWTVDAARYELQVCGHENSKKTYFVDQEWVYST